MPRRCGFLLRHGVARLCGRGRRPERRAGVLFLIPSETRLVGSPLFVFAAPVRLFYESGIGWRPVVRRIHRQSAETAGGQEVRLAGLAAHSARHASPAAASRCVGIMPFPEDTAGVSGPLHGIPACPFGLQHAIGYCGRVDIRSPCLHASTSAISISLRSNWLTRSLSETPLRTAIAERRIWSSRSR